MFSEVRADLLRMPRWLQALALTGITTLGACILMLISGIALNALVITANGGRMPVAMQKEDVLFVLGPAQYGVSYFPTAENLGWRYEPLTKTAKLRLLADRIPTSFKFVPQDNLPSWSYNAFGFFKIPVRVDGIASIGDLVMWLGLLFALPGLPAICVPLVWEITRRLHRKT
ncbi:MAG: DUF5317 family protein [bacterium]|nr:DUF5317 family protein [bacterium]